MQDELQSELFSLMLAQLLPFSCVSSHALPRILLSGSCILVFYPGCSIYLSGAKNTQVTLSQVFDRKVNDDKMNERIYIFFSPAFFFPCKILIIAHTLLRYVSVYQR